MSKELVLLVVLLVGLVGTFMPLLPGISLMFVAILVYAIFDKWVHFSPFFVAGIGIITFLSIIIDYMAGVIGAKKFGSSKFGTWGAILGALVGFFVIGPLGVFLGPVIGVILGEIISEKPLTLALKSSLGILAGVVGGTLLQVILALVILIWVYTKIYL